jgi:hypothetical protein
VLALCPPVRQLIWFKPGTPFGDKFIWTYESVLLRGCRRPSEYVRDSLYAIPAGSLMTFRDRPAKHVIGAKPRAFCLWLFACMGLHPDDELVDFFPGSGSVAHALDEWRGQCTFAQHPGQEQLLFSGLHQGDCS